MCERTGCHQIRAAAQRERVPARSASMRERRRIRGLRFTTCVARVADGLNLSSINCRGPAEAGARGVCQTNVLLPAAHGVIPHVLMVLRDWLPSQHDAEPV